MEQDAPDLATLEQLATSDDVRDRAFAASEVRRRIRTAEEADRQRLMLAYERIRQGARLQHEGIRGRICQRAQRAIDRATFVAELQEAPLELRDHLVEEILDIAYPPLEEVTLPREVLHDVSSGLAEILFAIEKADLGPDKTFVDLGSGSGKVVLLVALLTGAHAYGMEIDPVLVEHARGAARALNLDNARFIAGDIRDATLPPADVYYMYIPFMKSGGLASRLERVAAERPIRLFSQALDLRHFPWLKAADAASYWLEMYVGKSS